MRNRLLVVDDDEASCRLISALFSSAGLEVEAAHDGPSGLARAAEFDPEVVLLDVRLPGIDGLQVLEQFKARSPLLPVVMLTASRDVKTAVRATQLGAFDYLTKPIDQDEIAIVVQRALADRALQLEVADLRKRVGKDAADDLGAQMGPGAKVREIVEQVRVVAASTFTVLILGETGTGKELVAQAIHRQSDRLRRPFIALDCGAIPEPLLESELFGHEKGAFTGADRRRSGQFQLAEHGTCFLDEIGNLPSSLQSKLLRVIESRQMQAVGSERSTPIDIRFIAATNDDLVSRMQEGAFRADLYFRLAQYTIVLPPLRERPEDIAYLAQRFIDEASVELRRPVQQLMPGALRVLQEHRWPGNVRELRNVVRQAVLRSRQLVIQPEDLRAVWSEGPGDRAAEMPGPGPSGSLKTIADEAARGAERRAITDALRRAGGNKTQAAKILQTDYKTLYLKMKRLGISVQASAG